MVFITIPEILDIVIMTVAIGYIFTQSLLRFKNQNHYYKEEITKKNFLFSIYLVGPAIILHELGHKFTALALGSNATFFSSLSINKLIQGIPFFDFPAILMIIALASAYFGSGFIFFVPGYVAISSVITPIQTLLIAFAGPGINLVLWLGSKWLLNTGKIPHKYQTLAFLTGRINMFLFILNMIPIPGFDGFKVFTSLSQIIF